MSQQFLVIELAQPEGGQVKRIQIKYRSIMLLMAATVLVTLAGLGAFSSYMRMFLKVSHYNELRADFDHLRNRYQNLQQVSKQHNQEMASLESLASEISASYGINQPGVGESRPMDDDFAVDKNAKESIQQFNFLKSANYSHIYHHYASKWQSNIEPTIWPVVGSIRSVFGARLDPFSGEGAFHTGIDLAVSSGSAVHVTADGTVEAAGYSGRYGKLIIVDHGNGVETYYAHLSEYLVVPGQEVRRNETIGLSGASGHATGPHVHYEVRVAGTPVNPFKYMGKLDNGRVIVQAQASRIASTGHNDLGL
jgi:murein DD-endopeptidase MepM/ murein hydrolase activator NlpD